MFSYSLTIILLSPRYFQDFFSDLAIIRITLFIFYTWKKKQNKTKQNKTHEYSSSCHFVNLLSSSSPFNVTFQDYILKFPRQWKINLDLDPSIFFINDDDGDDDNDDDDDDDDDVDNGRDDDDDGSHKKKETNPRFDMTWHGMTWHDMTWHDMKSSSGNRFEGSEASADWISSLKELNLGRTEVERWKNNNQKTGKSGSMICTCRWHRGIVGGCSQVGGGRWRSFSPPRGGHIRLIRRIAQWKHLESTRFGNFHFRNLPNLTRNVILDELEDRKNGE